MSLAEDIEPVHFEFEETGDEILQKYDKGLLFWQTAKGKIKVQDMGASHIRSCLKVPLYPNKDNWDVVFKKELKRRVSSEVRLTVPAIKTLGFKPIPHYTVTNSHVYELGRGRHLSIGDVGTPNEMLWICEVSPTDPRDITDLVCLHNWDYDKYLTKEKLTGLIKLIKGK